MSSSSVTHRAAALALLVGHALDASSDRDVAKPASRVGAASSVVRAFDAKAAGHITRKACRRAGRTGGRAALDAAMCRRLASAPGPAIATALAFDANMLASIATRSSPAAIVLIEASDAKARIAIATKSMTSSAVMTRRGRVASCVRATLVEAKGSVARREQSEEERVAGHGEPATIASASARAKPFGRARKYSRAAEDARGRSYPARIRNRSTSAFSANGPSA